MQHGSGPGAGERPLARHLQAYFQTCFQLPGREPEQIPSWYLPATAPRQCQAGIGHQNLLLPPRAATTNQQVPQFWAPAQIPVLARLQFPSLMSWEAWDRPWRQVPRGCCQPGGCIQAACATRWYQWLFFPISIPATEPCSAKPRRRTHACNCTIKGCVNTAILSRRKQLPKIPPGLKDQYAFQQWMGLCLFSFSFS